MKYVVIAVLLAGCAASEPREIYAGDGKPAQLVECRKSITNCHDAARAFCRGAYVPMEDKSRSSIYGTANANGGILGTSHRFELTFRCQ